MQKISREEFKKSAEDLDRKNRNKFNRQYKKVFKDGVFLDMDGYPTIDVLKLIEIWHWSDETGWLNFIKSVWHLSSWGWHEEVGGMDLWLNEKIAENVIRHHISTAGWSGNEGIIRHMKKNIMLWSNTWVQSRRGGHYIFEIKNDYM